MVFACSLARSLLAFFKLGVFGLLPVLALRVVFPNPHLCQSIQLVVPGLSGIFFPAGGNGRSFVCLGFALFPLYLVWLFRRLLAL